jgi:DNA-binding NtrC family response regulator
VGVSQGRTLPLLGPAIVLYLAVELITRSRPIDGAAIVVAAIGLLASFVPMVLLRGEELGGARRLAVLSTASAIALVATAQPFVLSLPLEIAAALAWPPIGSLCVDLALDTPDRPPALARARVLRGLSHALALATAVLGLVVVLPAIDSAGTVLIPPSLAAVAPMLVIAQLVTALAVRLARRRLGSTPEALASNGWALLGIAFAAIAGVVAVTLVGASALPASASEIRGIACAGTVAIVLGHLAMLDSKRPIHAARASRAVVAALLAAIALGLGVGLLIETVPRDPIALAVLAVAFLATGVIAFHLARATVDTLFAPDGGRLLRAIDEGERALVSARSLEDVASAVLAPLRRAARHDGARPLIQTLAPAKQATVDAAGMPRAEPREMSPTILSRIADRPGEIVVLAPLRAQVVRRPDLRPLIDALELLDALCVVPIASGGELEGALLVARGTRRAPMTLEEIAALERLAARLCGPLAMHQAEARAQDRAGKAMLRAERLEERIEAQDDEIERLRAEARVLKAGRAADRLASPTIAYSPTMRALIARVQEIAPVDAPVQVIAEAGSAIDTIGHLIHAASAMRHGAFVVADCASVRPERSSAALFGDEGEEGAHPGWLRLASGGTLLLIDAPALSIGAQAELAEAIASRSARPEGGASAYPVDVRLVAHSRVDVAGIARVGAFDAELARRLEPLRLEVPSLRERPEDLPSLVLLALDRACRTFGREVLGIDEGALVRLVRYEWPGNLRELQSVIDRAVTAARGARVEVDDLPPLPLGSAAGDAAPGATHGDTRAPSDPLEGTWNEVEQRILRAALDRASGNKSEAARLLGMKRTTFLDKLRRSGLEARDSSPAASP